jgi:hypothetical protein
MDGTSTIDVSMRDPAIKETFRHADRVGGRVGR